MVAGKKIFAADAGAADGSQTNMGGGESEVDVRFKNEPVDIA